MPRIARQESQSSFYHVIARGAGRQIIFEDDTDRSRFLSVLERDAREANAEIFAWCLMSNHYHFLVSTDFEALSPLLHRANTSYAHYYNGRHGHVGPVFQNRFHSEPIESESHLLEAIRYIHLNPKDMGITRPGDYPWSSYRNYLGDPGFCETETVLDIIGGKRAFVDFHDISSDDLARIDHMHKRTRIPDEEAKRIIERLLGMGFANNLKSSDRQERNRAIAHFYDVGLSIRQIERLTGIGRGIIQDVVRNR